MLIIHGREVTNDDLAVAWPGVWPWVVKNFPAFAAMALRDDQFVSMVLFPNEPQADAPHTVSWNVACLCQSGNAMAAVVCELLNFLTPNHCAQAIKDEGPCPRALETGV